MQHADLMRPDEDWRELADASERRKIQNRIAQRAYRRNMRDRSNKIEQLSKQLRAYEELNLHIAPNEESTYQQRSSSPSILPPNKPGVGGCSPPWQATPSGSPSREHYVPFPHDSRFSPVQQQVCPAPMEQQLANTRPAPMEQQSANTRPAACQRMECWAPTNRQGTVAEPRTPVSSLSMEGGAKSDGILPLSSADLSPTTYEDFALDLAELANKGPKRTSLLHMAVAGNHLDTVKVLLQDERVMIDEEDNEGFTPLQRAVMQGRSEIVKLLLEHRANTGPVRVVDLPL